MSWLKRNEPIVLMQTSSIPYVVLEDGVFLCFDNLYCEKPDKTDHHISFIAYKNDFFKQSTNHFRLKQFPKLIPFKEIIALDDSVIEGHVIKQAFIADDPEPQKILIAHSSYLNGLEDKEFQELVEDLDDFDKSFLLVGADMDPQSRLLEGVMDVIYHRGWYPTAVSVADHNCLSPHRKYCWTASVPTLLMTIYSIETPDEMKKAADCFDGIGIKEKEMIWK